MKQNARRQEKRVILGGVSLGVGLFAANIALFSWVERIGINYLLANYARYVCAYGGFGAMIFGAMLINDFIVRKEFIKLRDSDLRELKAFIQTRNKKTVETNAERKLLKKFEDSAKHIAKQDKPSANT